MKTLREMTNEFDAELTRQYEEYVGLHKEFDTYRGKPVDDKVEEVNALLHKMQTKFQDIYPALYFIASRYEYACNLTKAHGEFIDSIVKAGGSYREKDSQQVS